MLSLGKLFKAVGSRHLCRNMASGVVISANPQKARIDDPIHIQVHGLQPHQKVTLASKLEESKKVWTSHAYYTATENGQVDLSQAVSEGGRFTGQEPMGLIWNISVADDPLARLLKRDMSSPIVTQLSVLAGHVDSDHLWDQRPLTQTSVERYHYQAENVVRIPVREGRIRGTLFLPTDSAKKYPGIIDLYGTTGGLLESRAALLASHGFATFALAYFNYDDLPEGLEPIELEYFEEAVEWLNNHENVISNNIGVIGISKGGEMALHIASISEKVKAVVAINSYFYNSTISHSYKGHKIPCIFPDLEHGKMEGDFLVLEDSYDKVENIEECYIPVEKSCAEFLLIHGAVDRLVLPYNGMRIARRLWDHGKDNVALHIYPGAGHIIEPRNSPICIGVFHNVLKHKLLYGGDCARHAYAQSDSWEKILHFFNKILMPIHSRL